MMTVQQAFDLALQHHQAGRLPEAEALYRQILAVQPNHAVALHFLGVIAHQVGRHDLAVEWIRRAIVLNPNNPAAHSNLGTALAEQGHLEEAMAAYHCALQLQSDDAATHHNLGNALTRQGRLDEAVASYRRALQLKPDDATTHHNLGNVLEGQGHLEEAIGAFRRAIDLNPNFAEAYKSLGNALTDHGQIDEAIAVCRRALPLQPDDAAMHRNLGNALARRGRLDEAVAAYRRVLQLKPDDAMDHYNLGNALKGQGHLDEAVASYREALQLKPDSAEVYSNLGNALTRQGRLDEAVAAYRRAFQLKPDDATTHGNLGTALAEQGRLDEALAAYRRVLQLKPEGSGVHSNLVYALHFHPSQDDRAIAEEQQRWNRQFSEPVKRFVRPQANDRNPERRLRIGYVSPDFREHVVGKNLVPLFRCHDPRGFEILCYSGVGQPDKLTEGFRQRADHWRSTAGLPDEALADMIWRDGVDILVDLTQHIEGNRLPVFARQPAPVQVSFAGYPESTGVEAIEYRISDRWVEANCRAAILAAEGEAGGQDGRPTGEHVFLIDSFWCYDPCGMDVEINKLPAAASGMVTFGSLNNFCKVNEPLLRLWARVLRELPGARLVMLSGLGSHRQRTAEFLEREGVAAGRVEFVERSSRGEYLKMYHRLDIVLDTFPYNGHTTSLDALWMGVPVVSLAGATRVSRGGLSVLSNLGLPELVAHSEDEYVEIATRLARDLPRLTELRATLRARMEGSVLMDAPRFARNIEVAYRAMWRRWCAEKIGA